MYGIIVFKNFIMLRRIDCFPHHPKSWGSWTVNNAFDFGKSTTAVRFNIIIIGSIKWRLWFIMHYDKSFAFIIEYYFTLFQTLILNFFIQGVIVLTTFDLIFIYPNFDIVNILNLASWILQRVFNLFYLLSTVCWMQIRF